MIKRISQSLCLLRNMQYFFGRKPRGSNVPTQSKILEPFSINCLHDNPGARYTAKKLGRGPASGKGKTCGRGIKGQRSRSGGGPHVRFEGGQTPLQKRLPKYGRVKQTRPKEFLDYINLQKIDYFVKLRVLNPNETITIRTLVQAGLVKKVKFGVKILGRGADRITYPLHLQVTDASKIAIDQIKKAGGSVSLVFRTPLKLKEHMFPQKYPLPLGEPIAPYWRVLKIQRKQADRGLPIVYTKPKWLVEDELKNKTSANKKNIGSAAPFIFPVPIVENSGKIRKRKQQIYRKISYKLP